MIIDFRVRPPFKSFCNLNIYGRRDPNPDPVTALGVWLDVPPFRSFEDRSIEAFVEEMDEAGIDVAVAMGRNSPAPWGSVLNSDIAELVATYPERFVGFGSVDGSSEDAVSQSRSGVRPRWLSWGLCPPIRDARWQRSCVVKA